ncbi:MAG: TPM domain-containing protein [Hyphomicrobiales bacterium]
MNKTAKELFTKEDKANIRQAMLNAELDTSANLTVYIELNCEDSAQKKAQKIFNKKQSVKCDKKHEILFYLAIDSLQYAVIGGEEVINKFPDSYWNEITESFEGQLKKKLYKESLIKGIEITGRFLKKLFPCQTGNVDDLNEEIIIK